jgi:hypothetical protein
MAKNDKKRAKEQAKELEKAARRASEAEAQARATSEPQPSPARAEAAASAATAAAQPARPKAVDKPASPKPRKAAEAKAGGDAGSSEAKGHHPAKAHGRPMSVDTSLPGSRDELLALHAAARRRRAAAAYGSAEHRAAIDDIGRIEIRIADVDHSMTPPRG